MTHPIVSERNRKNEGRGGFVDHLENTQVRKQNGYKSRNSPSTCIRAPARNKCDVSYPYDTPTTPRKATDALSSAVMHSTLHPPSHLRSRKESKPFNSSTPPSGLQTPVPLQVFEPKLSTLRFYLLKRSFRWIKQCFKLKKNSVAKLFSS